MNDYSNLMASEDYLKIFKRTERLMSAHKRRTKKHFKTKCELIERSLFFLYYAGNLIEKGTEDFKNSRNAQCIHSLFLRNISFLKSAYFQTLYGWYIPAKATLRSAYENWLVMEYLLSNPDRIDVFVKLSDFSPEDKRKPENKAIIKEFSHTNLLKKTSRNEMEKKGYSMFYSMLCDYTHVTMKGVLLEERFNEQSSKDNLLLILELTVRTIDSFSKQELFNRLIQTDCRYASLLEKFMNEVTEHLEKLRKATLHSK